MRARRSQRVAVSRGVAGANTDTMLVMSGSALVGTVGDWGRKDAVLLRLGVWSLRLMRP
jgi:uncharacterized protein YqfA (UPF0365 family)